MKIVKKALEFDWDNGNINKNLKHDVGDQESEEAFFDDDKKIFKDSVHSGKEERFILLGKTRKDRRLYISFTLRGQKIRVISARDINRKEVSMYEETT